MKRQLLIPILLFVFGVGTGLFLYVRDNTEKIDDYTEYFCGYDDRIAYIVEGYIMHWDGFSPENLELSYIYKYESPFGGFVKYDLDGDGTEELFLGDQFEDGSYQIYDIYTFDKTTGDIIHLFCGGERNWCTFNGSGVIIETGSNSADESFTKYYILKNLKLKKLGRNQPITKDILVLELDKFVSYANLQQGNSALSESQQGNGGPQMKVIVDNEGGAGRYISENETSYQGETQDTYWIEKDKAHIETMKACEGQGFLTLKEPGSKPVFSRSDTSSEVVGTMIHEQGYVPEVYRCLGYVNGWFLADVDGKSGYIREEFVNWDAINTF